MPSDNTFFCETLRCDGMTYISCIRRQLARDASGPRSYRYPVCAGECDEGKRIREAHPELVALAKKPRHAKPLDMTEPRETFETFYHREPDLSRSVKDIKKEKEEREMAKFKDRKCECGNTFTPNGPRQERCDDCRKARKKEIRQLAKEAKAARKKTASRKPAPNLPGGNGEYAITVDLSVYPEVHKRLLALAREEFRTPEMQLLKMLDEEFRRRELAA